MVWWEFFVLTAELTGKPVILILPLSALLARVVSKMGKAHEIHGWENSPVQGNQMVRRGRGLLSVG